MFGALSISVRLQGIFFKLWNGPMGDVDMVALQEHAASTVDRVAPEEQNVLCSQDYISTKSHFWDCQSKSVLIFFVCGQYNYKRIMRVVVETIGVSLVAVPGLRSHISFHVTQPRMIVARTLYHSLFTFTSVP